ncbi:MAG: hypothetical protein L6455_16100 [Kiritimatiellae bacterium]|nr:hypothetical protein [Kiritimatiellia bacterium]
MKLFFILGATAGDPVVSNVRASQQPGTQRVNILYDLSTTKTVSVSVAISTNAGLTFDLTAKELSGDGYGSNITAGTDKQIMPLRQNLWISSGMGNFPSV